MLTTKIKNKTKFKNNNKLKTQEIFHSNIKVYSMYITDLINKKIVKIHIRGASPNDLDSDMLS